jgi:hypothetical protein
MGRTVPTFRMALENEIRRWMKGYGKALRKNDRDIFDTVMNLSRLHGDAGTMSGHPIIFEVMMMNIILEQEKQLLEVQKQVIELQKKLEKAEKSKEE